MPGLGLWSMTHATDVVPAGAAARPGCGGRVLWHIHRLGGRAVLIPLQPAVAEARLARRMTTSAFLLWIGGPSLLWLLLLLSLFH